MKNFDIAFLSCILQVGNFYQHEQFEQFINSLKANDVYRRH